MPADRTKASTSPQLADGTAPRPISMTCIACRIRKVKCSSDKPSCSACVLNSQECVYKERLKPGLKQGVGSELLERVAALEAALTRESSRIDGLSMHFQGISASPTDTHRSASIHSGHTPTASSNYGPLYPPIDPTPLMPPPVLASAPAPAMEEVKPELLASLYVETPDLPPPDMVLTLIDLFFRYISPFIPILVREDLIPNNGEWPITVYAVVAVALRFSNDERFNDVTFPTKAAFRQVARQRVVLHAVDNTTDLSLQALAVMGIDTIGAGTGPSSWGSLAMITRGITHVGLQSEEALSTITGGTINKVALLPRPSTFAQAEGRRRLFWAAYLLDRWSAVNTGWELALGDFDVFRDLPCREEYWLNNITVTTTPFRSATDIAGGPFLQPADIDYRYAALASAFDLLGRVHQLHREPFDVLDPKSVEAFCSSTAALDKASVDWFSRLPTEMRETVHPQSHPLTVLVQAVYFATLIKLHSIIAQPPNLSQFMQPSSVAEDVAYANAVQLASIAATVSELIPSGGPYLAWCFWVGARALFIKAYYRSAVIDPAIMSLLRGLDVSGRYWDLAGQYSRQLQLAIRKLAGLTTPSRSTAVSLAHGTAVSVLLDLRKTCYPQANGQTTFSGTATPAFVPAEDVTSSLLEGYNFDSLNEMLNGWSSESRDTLMDDGLDFPSSLYSWFELPTHVEGS